MIRRFAVLASLMLMAACQVQDSSVPTLQLDGAPIRFSAATVDVVEAYRSPMQEPNVEHLFPTPPADALKQWANQRLQAAGGEGRLEFAIEDASVVTVDLPKTPGFKGAFTTDQDKRYDARLTATARLYVPQSSLAAAEASVTVTRSSTIREKATIAERDRLFQKMTDELMRSFNSEMEGRLRANFANYIQ